MPYNQRRVARPTTGRRTYHVRPKSKKRSQTKQFIHPSRFIQAAKPPQAAEAYEPFHEFADFDVAPLLKENLAAKGYKTPSPIQDQAIVVGLEGNDVVGIANTGTGKTLAFALPLLQALITNPQNRALIMAPTRELAQQIEDECRAVGKNSKLYGALLIGGTAMGPQLKDLRCKPQIVIGTPGRIKDHMDRGTLDPSKFNMVVLDEVDRMLDMGFINDMRTILQSLHPERQSFFFSATMDEKVKSLIRTFLDAPVTVSVKTGDTSEYVEQNVVRFNSTTDKIEKLHDLLIDTDVAKTLVFDETQRNVERLSKELHERGFKVDAIHGGKTQGQRQRALSRFKENNINVLVATDVAARGIDVADISHVVNYSTPQDYDTYVHRIGRAGRAGRIGFALTFVEQR